MTASSTVRAYLAAMEARDLETANAFLATDFQMTFPGDMEFTTLKEMIEWGSLRYRSIGKSYERFDESKSSDGEIVYCFGTLHGEWLNGSQFADIRFIDRFVVRDGLLSDQKVWNDLAEFSTKNHIA